jgi:hypothetical protein
MSLFFPKPLRIDLHQILLFSFPLSRNLDPRLIGFSPYFPLLFHLIKPLSWILLFNSFPMPVTMLKSEFQIKSYGFLKFPKSSLTFPLHFHVASTWFPLTCVILCGTDMVLLWHPPCILFVVGSSPFRFFSPLTHSSTKTFSLLETLFSITWMLPTLHRR